MATLERIALEGAGMESDDGRITARVLSFLLLVPTSFETETERETATDDVASLAAPRLVGERRRACGARTGVGLAATRHNW